MVRNQFTFYASFWETAKRIKSKAARADLYDTICRYALEGEEPDLDKLPESVAVAFINAKPNLDASRKKAENGKHGGSKPKANGKQNESKPKQSRSEKENENEKEKENEIEIEAEKEKEKKQAPAQAPGRAFTEFWNAYPPGKGGDRQEAWAAWRELNPDTATAWRIMDSLNDWKDCEQWLEQGGRFIPGAAKFLRERRWMAPPAICPEGDFTPMSTADIIRQACPHRTDLIEQYGG